MSVEKQDSGDCLLDQSPPKIQQYLPTVYDRKHYIETVEWLLHIYGAHNFNCVTITFRPPKLHTLTNRIRYDNLCDLYDYICMRSKRFKDSGTRFILFPELTFAGDLHYHGICFLDSHVIRSLYTRFINKHIGWCKIEPIKDPNNWQKYITKDQDAMEAYTRYKVLDLPNKWSSYIDFKEIKLRSIWFPSFDDMET